MGESLANMESQLAPRAAKAAKAALDKNNNAGHSSSRNSKNYEKYSLRPRSIQNRIETEKRQKNPKKEPKPKHKPPPLSKYRRKTANARERGRMREINDAFDCLQRAVPQYPVLPVMASGKPCEKLTKITTLRLAMNYIEALTQMLNPPASSTAVASPEMVLSPSLPSSLVQEDNLNCASSTCSSIDSSASSSGVSSAYSISGSVSEFSPASSYTMSPMSSGCSPASDCIQTVMRSVVPPATAAAMVAASAAAAAANNNCQPAIIIDNHLIYSHSSRSPNPVQILPSLPTYPTQQILISPMSLCSSPKTKSHSVLPVTTTTKLPPISSSLSSALMRKSMGSFMADIGMSSSCATRNGSLSSLTESDLSEYASDLLSDEGSTLDDPMFDDLIGVNELDLLLESTDADSLHFSTELSNNVKFSCN